MMNKRGIEAQPKGSSGVSPGTSPVNTPGAPSNEIGDGATAYNAMSRKMSEGVKADSEFEDLEGRGILNREESEVETSVGPDVEMRSVSEIEQDESRAKNNRRLTILQLERFRRAIAADKNKHGRRSSSSQWNAKVRRGEVFTSVFTENPDGINTGPACELRIVNYPWAMWVLGSLLIIAASIFVDHIHKKALSDERMKAEEATVNWWKYLVAGIVYVCAAAVFLNGRIETFVMNRELGLLSIRSTKVLCPLHKLSRTRVVEKELRCITDVRIEASGEILSGEVDTRAYKVHFDFDDGTHTTTLEGRSKKKALVRCRLIKQFLLSCAPVDTPSPSGSDSASGSGSGTLSPLATMPVGPAVILPPRGASGNLSLAVPPPPGMSAVSQSPRRFMMVAAVPSTLSQKTAPPGQASTR